MFIQRKTKLLTQEKLKQTLMKITIPWKLRGPHSQKNAANSVPVFGSESLNLENRHCPPSHSLKFHMNA